ncbi:JAB domain-containing protein [Hoylesella nanceiensis]|uniref:JAB domain-containing protein n=1 Tax=Hoylesella nanceiensis TaxID=425941 RepID=UPI002432D1EC|nr:JAB domain-containing protein [Hoylesella nanceiensis]
MIIREMPSTERPRDKGLRYGVRSLSSRELLALILRTGSQGESVLMMADNLLQMSKGIKGLVRMSNEELCKIKGISKVKALQLQAIFEISRRASLEAAYEEEIIDNPERIIDWLRNEIGTGSQEKFLVGTINASAVYPREIFKEALLIGSTDIMLAHNHPSGVLTPSTQDLVVTGKLMECGKLMGVRVLDHLIVSQTSFLSFAREELFETCMEAYQCAHGITT